MQLSFVKMQGAGNQIVVVDRRRSDRTPPSAELLRQLGSSERGPGFDQLMWLGAPRDASMTASYRVFNADGSEVEQCGNGVRCVALLLAQQQPGERRFMFESPAGPIEARVLDDDRVAVNMGPPVFDPRRVPFVADSEADSYALEVDGDIFEVAVLSMGNPHCVLDVDDVGMAEVARLGPLIEHHPRFPASVNVGFMRRRDRSHIELRVHERGVGETLACGTGACAAVVAGRRRGQLDEQVSVELPGGQLMVSWPGDAEPVWLTGSAEVICEGTIDL